MKRIEYSAIFQHQKTGNVSEEIIRVFAKDINSGFRKATAKALKRPAIDGWEIASLAFSQVTS
jgi:hypothetical protein